jgi:hypothetical protein
MLYNETEVRAQTSLSAAVESALGKSVELDALLQHLPRSKSGRPSTRWWTRLEVLIEAFGRVNYNNFLLTWLHLLTRPMAASALPLANGLIWAASGERDELCNGLLAQIAATSWRRGRASVEGRLGAVCVAALGWSEVASAASALVWLKLKLRAKQPLIDRALEHLSEALGRDVEELDAMGQPTLGLGADGVRRQVFGEWVGLSVVDEEELRVETSWERAASHGQLRLLWGDEGEPEAVRAQKSAPSVVRGRYGCELWAFELGAQELERALSAQRERFEAMLRQPRVWRAGDHRELFMEHALVGPLARRLVWWIEPSGERGGVAAREVGGVWRDARGERVEVGDADGVSLWHPAQADEAEREAWVRHVSETGLKQPIRQIGRDVWELPELAHGDLTWPRQRAQPIRQLYFAALARSRGWHVELIPRRGVVGQVATIEVGRGRLVELWAQALDGQVEARGVPSCIWLLRMRCLDEQGRHVALDELCAATLSELRRDLACFVEVASRRERLGA